MIEETANGDQSVTARLVTLPPERQKIPPSIAVAIAKVMQAVGTIGKDAHNKHGGYDYASVDAVYEGCRKAMAEAGLVIIPMEEEVAKIDEKLIKFVFSFLVATETDTWEDPRNRRTVYLQWMGPQSFQAGQSYCEKAFHKGMFKLNTGDAEQEGLPGGSIADNDAKGKKGKPKVEQFSADESLKKRTEIIAEISKVEKFDAQSGEDFAAKHGPTISRMTQVDGDMVRNAYAIKAKRG